MINTYLILMAIVIVLLIGWNVYIAWKLNDIVKTEREDYYRGIDLAFEYKAKADKMCEDLQERVDYLTKEVAELDSKMDIYIESSKQENDDEHSFSSHIDEKLRIVIDYLEWLDKDVSDVQNKVEDLQYSQDQAADVIIKLLKENKHGLS